MDDSQKRKLAIKGGKTDWTKPNSQAILIDLEREKTSRPDPGGSVCRVSSGGTLPAQEEGATITGLEEYPKKK